MIHRMIHRAARAAAPALLLLAAALGPGSAPPAAGGDDPLAHTYSIVARDPATGQLGVAVQSHWFQVGPLVPWARAGVGAVATQSFVRVDYGPRGLELMAEGVPADGALGRLLAADDRPGVRQVAMVDAAGRVAAWTGPDCIAEAGHRAGDGYSVQANLMANDTVWDAMATAYESAEGDLAERLLVALEAAERAGGDLRGRQSAALLVVRSESTGEPWEDRLVDLRVDDHPRPLEELRRLLELDRAYDAMNRGDEALAEGDVEAALAHYTRATELAEGNPELPFWQAVTLASAGRVDDALPIFRSVFAAHDRWVELVRRLPPAGLLPDDPELVGRILAQADGPAAGGTAAARPAAGAGVVAVEGTLGTAGDACPLLRTDDGTVYSLVGDLGGLAAGDRVRLEGRPAQATICDRGTTLLVERAEPAGPPDDALMRVEGELTGEGVECPVLRTDDGTLYSLAGSLGDLSEGQRVWVEGTVAQISLCMQGTTIQVEAVGPAGDPHTAVPER